MKFFNSKYYCSHKFPWFPHPLDQLFNHYACRKCLNRYDKFKENPKYSICDLCLDIQQISKMRYDSNVYGTFYTCKNCFFEKDHDCRTPMGDGCRGCIEVDSVGQAEST